MNVPRFEAQLQAIQVPSMKNYQAEQNIELTKELSSFGDSVLKATKKIQDSYIEAEEEKQRKEKKAQDELEKLRLSMSSYASYNSDLYNSGLDSVEKIYSESTNPAEAEEYTNSYVEGVSSQMPQQNEQYVEFMEEANYAHQEIAQEQYVQSKTNENVQNTIYNLDRAGSFLKNASTDKLFNVYFGNIVAQNERAVAKGIITANEAEENIRRSLKGYASERYRRIMADDSIPMEQRYAFRDEFVSGENEFDKRFNVLTYGDRQAIVNTVDAEVQARDAKIKQYTESFEKDRHEAFMNETAATIYDLTSKNSNPDIIDSTIEQLEQKAKTKEEYDYLIKLRSTGPKDAEYMVSYLDAKEIGGTLTKEDLDTALEGNKISTKTYNKKIAYLNTPLYSNQQSTNYKEISARIKDKFPQKAASGIFVIQNGSFVPSDDNKELRTKAMQYLNSKVSSTTAITPQEWQEIQKDVMNYADSLGNNKKQETEIKIQDDFKNYGIDKDKIKKKIKDGNENSAQADIYKKLKSSGVDKETAKSMSAEMINSIKLGG